MTVSIPAKTKKKSMFDFSELIGQLLLDFCDLSMDDLEGMAGQ